MDCVDISQISKSHQVPGHFLIPVHFQPGQVAIEIPIYSVILIAFLEACVILQLIERSRVWAVSIDIVIEIPASVLIECREQQKEFAVNVTTWIAVF